VKAELAGTSVDDQLAVVIRKWKLGVDLKNTIHIDWFVARNGLQPESNLDTSGLPRRNKIPSVNLSL
jgi:hypothetical protein